MRSRLLFLLLGSLAATIVAAQDTPRPPRGAVLDHYIIVVLENQDAASILQDDNFRSIAAQGILQTNYHAVTHPSQPNCTYVKEAMDLVSIIINIQAFSGMQHICYVVLFSNVLTRYVD